MPETAYIGTELEVFGHARNWKAYVHSQLRPYAYGDVLEVGAGIGSNTQIYFDGSQNTWVCLEPDRSLADRIPRHGLLGRCKVIAGTLPDVPDNHRFDLILYIDVLEHIEDDAGELAMAAALLKPGGRIVVLSPAHQWLYTAFDRAVGHFRRYTTKALAAIGPPHAELRVLRYLDAIGVAASLANRALLRSATPNVSQIRLWDRLMVPVSKYIDPLFGYRLGKSVLAIWQSRM
jgi:SAM-dependent methyltransferase